MDVELEEQIFAAAPSLYRHKDAGNQKTALGFGINCGNGWYELIRDLSQALEGLGESVTAFQVKEKFGGLRFYVTNGSIAAYSLIEEAEKSSFKICELCGKEGKLQGGSWLVVCCEGCARGEEEGIGGDHS